VENPPTLFDRLLQGFVTLAGELSKKKNLFVRERVEKMVKATNFFCPTFTFPIKLYLLIKVTNASTLA